MSRKILFVSILLIVCLVSFLIVLLLKKPPLSHNFPPTDAMLIHGYWLSQKDNGPVTLSLRSELEVKAAYLLYINHKTNYLVITGGPIWGKTYPTIGEVMKKYLIKLGIPQEKIILRDTAMDTYEEVQVFLNIAKEQHFTSLGDLAAMQHQHVIMQLFKMQNSSASYMSYENVIDIYGSSHDKALVKNLSQLVYSFGLGTYEFAVRIILLVDPHYQLLGRQAHATRNHKGPYGGVPLLPVDQYQL